jgi:P-type E1-E2 ATPase
VPVLESSLFLYTPGKGVTCSIDGAEIVVGSRACLDERGLAVEVDRSTAQSSEILVAKNGTIMGSVLISDALRSEATQAIRSLRELGIRTILLTGDSSVIARAVAKELGVDEVDAELLPDQKLLRIRELLAQGKKVGMVGDGVNDAPALMQATVGIAMGSGTDVARESADIVLLGNDLSKVVETVKVARRCRRIILANFAGTLSVDALGVGLAAFGFLNPLLAAFIHVSSELAFILNSARLLPVPRAHGNAASSR